MIYEPIAIICLAILYAAAFGIMAFHWYDTRDDIERFEEELSSCQEKLKDITRKLERGEIPKMAAMSDNQARPYTNNTREIENGSNVQG